MYSNNWSHSRTSRERLYRELGLESLNDRCWFRKLTFFYKIVKGLFPPYLTKYVNLRSTSIYQTRPGSGLVQEW